MTWTQLKLLPSELQSVSHLRVYRKKQRLASWFGMEKGNRQISSSGK